MKRKFLHAAMPFAAPLLGGACSYAESEPTTTFPGEAVVVEVPIMVVTPDMAWDSDEASLQTGNLDRAVAAVEGPAQLHLQPGHYYLEPEAYEDPTCGNCDDLNQTVLGTVGLIVSGQDLTIFGEDRDSVMIHTGTGYGILFQDCERCVLRGVTVTGGARDPDPRATNGGVVARASSLILQRCQVSHNVGDPEVVRETGVGMAGVVGREGSKLAIRTCRIEGNSWDGVALYEDAEAVIRGNTIDGVGRVSAGQLGAGRGVGIGVAGNAQAVIEENLVRRYWKGIGVFAEARAEIRENVVEEVKTWGIALSSGNGTSPIFVENNVVFRTGACGILVDVATGPAELGSVSKNVLVSTTLDAAYDNDTSYCPQQPLARVGIPRGWQTEGNLFHGNRLPGPGGDTELDQATFIEKAMSLYTFHIEPQAATTHSAFMDEFKGAFGPPFR